MWLGAAIEHVAEDDAGGRARELQRSRSSTTPCFINMPARISNSPCVSATTNSGSFEPTPIASGAMAAGGRNRTSNDGKLPTAGTASFPPTAAGTLLEHVFEAGEQRVQCGLVTRELRADQFFNAAASPSSARHIEATCLMPRWTRARCASPYLSTSARSARATAAGEWSQNRVQMEKISRVAAAARNRTPRLYCFRMASRWPARPARPIQGLGCPSSEILSNTIPPSP